MLLINWIKTLIIRKGLDLIFCLWYFPWLRSNQEYKVVASYCGTWQNPSMDGLYFFIFVDILCSYSYSMVDESWYHIIRKLFRISTIWTPIWRQRNSNYNKILQEGRNIGWISSMVFLLQIDLLIHVGCNFLTCNMHEFLSFCIASTRKR